MLFGWQDPSPVPSFSFSYEPWSPGAVPAAVLAQATANSARTTTGLRPAAMRR